MELQYDCYAKDGVLFIKNREVFNEEIKSLSNDKEYSIIIRTKRKTRSNGQNRYYWGIVIPLVLRGLKEVGFNIHNKEDAHDIIKFKFLKVNIENESGEFIESFKSTKEMNTKEFKEFIDALQIWASEYLNTYIPSPNEELDIEFI